MIEHSSAGIEFFSDFFEVISEVKFCIFINGISVGESFFLEFIHRSIQEIDGSVQIVTTFCDDHNRVNFFIEINTDGRNQIIHRLIHGRKCKNNILQHNCGRLRIFYQFELQIRRIIPFSY